MDDPIEEVEIKEYDSLNNVTEKVMEAFLSSLEQKEEVLVEETDWKDEVTRETVANLIRIRQDTDTVTFTSTHEKDEHNYAYPKDSRDTGRGRKDGHDSTNIFAIACPKCYGVGDVEVSHGWNCYYQCDNCGQHIKKSG